MSFGMNGLLTRLGHLTGCLLLACTAGAACAETLQDVQVSALPGDSVELILNFSGPAQTPQSFTIDDPARIALDLPGVANGLIPKSRNVGVGVLQSLESAQGGGRTRMVLNVVRLVPYTVRVDGNRVRVVLRGTAAAQSSVALPGVTAADVNKLYGGSPGSAAPGTSPPLGGRYLANVDFRRGDGGAGRVIVTLSDPSMLVDLRQEGGRVLVDFAGAQLPETLERRLDVTDFATPIVNVDTFTRAGGVRMAIDIKGDFDHFAYQANDTYVVEVRPVTKEQRDEDKKKKFIYTGERLSLNFQNIEVRAVLQLIADFTGLNLVTSDSVEGSLTLRLKNVPWDQALDIILKTKGLGMRQLGNVILVAPTEELAAREKLELESKKQLEELAPLRSEFIQVNYAKAADISKLLKSPENTLLTLERGTVSVDERTNTLLVQDTAEKLADVRKLVAILDVPVRQVLIESRVVIANDDFNKELGVRFGVSGVRGVGDGAIITSGNIGTPSQSSAGGTQGGTAVGDDSTPAGLSPPAFGGTDQLVRDTRFSLDSTGNIKTGIPTVPDRLNVNLPVANPAGSIAIALLGSNHLLDLELSALQAEGRGELISSPRVITANQQEAVIKQGVEIPYQQATSSGATSVEFKEAVLSLKVKPQITPDDRIIMDLTVNKDSVGDIFLGVPSINTREVSTQVLIDNGQTVVLGGVYEQTRADQVDRVPFLGDLPGIGALFRNTLKTDEKEELLIFVTPKIIKEGLAIGR